LFFGEWTPGKNGRILHDTLTSLQSTNCVGASLEGRAVHDGSHRTRIHDSDGELVPVSDRAGARWQCLFTEVNGNHIARITPGGFISEFSVSGNPGGIVAGANGAMWFTEIGGNKIGEITTDGSTVTEFTIPTAGSFTHTIAAGPDGALWFAEAGGNKIGRITTSGLITGEFAVPTAGATPFDIAAGPDGNLWFTEIDGDKIGRITPAGVITEFSVPTPGAQPALLTAGPDGAVWFTELAGNKIGRITPGGSISEFAIPTPGSQPQGIVAGPDGALWFTEENANQIGRITPDGTISEFPVSTAGAAPFGIVTGPDGNIWFTEFNGNKIGDVTPNPLFGALAVSALGDFDNSGNPDFIFRNDGAALSMGKYNPAAQTVANINLGAVPGWEVLGAAHFSDADGTSASTTQMLMDYVPNGTMTLWWVSNGALTGIDLGQRWPNIGFIANGQFTNDGGAGIANFLVTNNVDHHLYNWWITPQNQLTGFDITAISGVPWANIGLVATGRFTANGGTNLLVNNTLDHHLYDWWINSNNTLAGIDLGPNWSNNAFVAGGQFTANGNTNFLVTNTVDHHLYDWWISANNTLTGIDLGAVWSNIALVTSGHFDGNTTNTEFLVQNTVDHHLYEWWITPQGQLTGIDLGLHWLNIQLIGSSHYNNNSPNDELLVRNTVDGHFYEWWIAGNQLQGVDLGAVPTGATTAGNASATAAGPGAMSATSLLVQSMASFGSSGPPSIRRWRSSAAILHTRRRSRHRSIGTSLIAKAYSAIAKHRPPNWPRRNTLRYSRPPMRPWSS
jgi:streptogramin lyase